MTFVMRGGPKVAANYEGEIPDISDPVAWFEYVTGEPLYSWQAEELAILCAEERPQVAYIQVARKNGKSRLGAAVAICEARLPNRHIYTIADSERNLNSTLMREISEIIAASPILSAAFIPYKNRFVVPSSGSFIETRPNNFRSSQSINPHLVVFDEVHLQKEDSTWHGMRMAGAARKNPLLLGITTPGMDLNAPAHYFYESIKAGTPSMYGKIYEPDNPETAYDDEDQWYKANPRLIDDPDFIKLLRLDREALPEHQFRRFRLGQWTASSQAWLPYGAWPALAKKRELSEGSRIILGFDGSFSGDSTALIGATLGEEYPYVFVVGCWENPGSTGWRVPRTEVMAAVDKAFKKYKVDAMYCDPPYWGREIAEWGQMYGADKVLELPTGSHQRMAPLCTTFYSAVIEGQLSHDGDPRLARHINNCVIKPTMSGDVITKPDPMSPAKIDLAVAAVLAYGYAARMLKRRSPIFVI